MRVPMRAVFGCLLLTAACAAESSNLTNIDSTGGPTVTALLVSPGTVTLQPGQKQQFGASASLSDGSKQTATVTWSATGGTMTSGGMYTAGSATGTFQVVGQAANGAFADTATVTISTTAPPVTNCTNEPAGMTMVTNTAWDAMPLQYPKPNADGWTYEYTPEDISIFQDATAPKSPSNVLRTTFPQGMQGGGAPTTIDHALPSGMKTLFVCLWLRRSADWDDSHNVGTKHFFVLGNDGTQFFISFTHDLSDNHQYHYFGIESPDASANLDGYTNFDETPGLGSWHKYEYVFVSNTAGAANGTMTGWRDGVLMMQFNNLKYAKSGQAASWYQLDWSPTFGGGLNPVPHTEYIDVDHFYVSAK